MVEECVSHSALAAASLPQELNHKRLKNKSVGLPVTMGWNQFLQRSASHLLLSVAWGEPRLKSCCLLGTVKQNRIKSEDAVKTVCVHDMSVKLLSNIGCF